MNSTYTATPLDYLGCFWNGSTAATQTAFFDNITVIGPTATTPVITVSTASLPSFGDITIGNSSSSQSFTVEGSNLTNDITVTSPTGFEIRKGTDAFSTSPVTLTHSGGTVATTTIDARFTPGTIGAFSGNIASTSTGATTKNVSVSGNGVINYYSTATGFLNATANWGTNTDGTGTNPTNFTDAGQVFNIRNNAAPTIDGNWTVSGSLSKIVLGNGTNAVDFTIPSSLTVTGTIDLSANGTLTLENTTMAHTIGTVSATSTVNYAQNATMVTPSSPTTYGNLKLTNGTKTFASGTYTVQGNMTVDGVTDLNGAGSPFTTINLAGNFVLQGSSTFSASPTERFTLVCNGTSAQTLQGNGNSFHLFRVTLQNTSGVALSTSGGSSNLTVGNATSGGVTLTSGSLTTNSNTVTFVTATTGPSILSENATNRIIGTVIIPKVVGLSSSTLGNIGISLAAGADSLDVVTVTRVTGSAGIVTIGANSGIARKYTVSSTLPPSAGRNVTLAWLSPDDNSKTLTSGAIWKSTDSGTNWSEIASGDYSTRSVTFNQTSFGDYTVSDASSPLPVQLSAISLTSNRLNATINWTTATEVNNYGFEIERRAIGATDWSPVGFVAGKGNSNTPTNYNYTDASVAAGRYAYRIKQVDRDGTNEYFAAGEVEVGIAAKMLTLEKNYPNPFNPATSIEFTVPIDGMVSLKVFNIIGEEVATLYNGAADAGKIYKASFNASSLPSGLYFARLNQNGGSLIQKMMLTK